MTITYVIKKVAVKRLAEYGFKYDGMEASGIWMFSKPVGEETQYIMFQKSNLFKGIRLEMYTSVPQEEWGNSFYASNFVEKWTDNIVNDFWEYVDDLSLVDAINEQVDIAIKHGIDALNALMTPIVLPYKQMEIEFSVNTYEKAMKFSKKYNLDYLDIKKSLVRLQDVIESMTSMELDECKEELINAAAYFGELIRKFHGGTWYWDDEEDSYSLRCHINSSCYDYISTLDWIVRFWGNPKFVLYSLLESYALYFH